MTNTKHTPAPWYVIGGTVCDNYGQDILGHELMEAFPAEYQANARLIVAAPDLLEALEMLTVMTRAALKDNTNEGLIMAFQKANAAIAKAEGKA